MSVYMISYDLNEEKNYDAINNAIKNQGKWAKILTTTYIVISDYPSAEIRNNIQKDIDSDDKIFVARLKGETAWTNSFSEAVTNWLINNINADNI